MSLASYNRAQVLDQLKKLTPVQYQELIFRIRAPREYLPAENSPLVKQAIDLLIYAENNPDFLRQLQETLERLLHPQASTRPAGELENEAGNLVYFLANRHPQEHKLCSALKAWNQDEKQPFVGIFYGADNQHDCFVERLLGHSFRAQADLMAALKPLYNVGNGALRLDGLEQLAHLPLELEACLDKRRVAAKISREYERRPVLYFEMDSREWRGNAKRNTVTEFIRYCRESALLRQGKYPPLIFLGFQIESVAPWLSWLSPRQRALKSWFAHQEKLDAAAFLREFKTPGAVLPQLADIPYADVMRWADSDELKTLHPQLKNQTAALRLHIEKQLYAAKKPLPMRELGVALAQLCAQFS